MLAALLTCILLFPKDTTTDPIHVAQQELLSKLTNASFAAMAPFSSSSQDVGSPLPEIMFDPLYMRISGVEEKQQTIEVVMKANVIWNDYRLSWNPAEYGGIDKVVMTRDWIWRPIVLPCNFISLTTDDNAKGLVMVNRSGYAQDIVMWTYVEPVSNIDLHSFPFDKHTLEICFDVLALEHLHVKLVGKLKQSYNDTVGSEWNISKRMKLEKSKSDSSILFSITLERYSNFWIHLIIIPCFVLGFLIIAGLVLNSDNPSIESVVLFMPNISFPTHDFHVNIGLASTVSTAVVISTMTDNFPKTSHIPSLGSFVRNQILIILAAIVTLSIRSSLMNTIEMFINYLEKDMQFSRTLKWKKILVAIIKFGKYRYFLFIMFELAHFACFLWMMRHAKIIHILTTIMDDFSYF